MATDIVSGNLISRNYSNFRGIDLSNRKDEVHVRRSPDSLNMWKNYKSSNGKCIETRPDIVLHKAYDYTIFGLFFYTYNGKKHEIVHAGNKLYDDGNVIYSDMATQKSTRFVYENKLYWLDGKNYLVYDGKTCKEVEGYIPTTVTGMSPTGKGTILQEVNLLTGLQKNMFVADGTSVEYQLACPNETFDSVETIASFDNDYKVRVWITKVINEKVVEEEQTTGFTAYPDKGKIVFNTAPEVPYTDGQPNVTIQFKKEIKGYRDRINKCTLVEIFDNRVFFSGNPDYPHVIFNSSLNMPHYCSDLDYYEEGTSDSSVKALVSGNNALWVFKEPSQSNTTVFYHNPTLQDDGSKTYPSTHSSISTGCVATGTNFNDDIVFFSDRGLEAISGDVTTEQILAHRSTLIDNKLLNEKNYKDLVLAEYEGYLMVFIDNKVYLANSNEDYTNFARYEWFYWEMNRNITSALVKDGVLYLCSDKEIYTLTNNNETREIESYWTTLEDEFKYPQYQKTTNKRGCVIDANGEEVSVYARTDNNKFEKIDKYKIRKGYVVPRIKKKKWKAIQLKLQSTKPFSIYSLTLESYVGNYVKR